MAIVVNGKFENDVLNSYDVMQHIRNIYSILGTTEREGFGNGNGDSFLELVQEAIHRSMIDWVGTREEYTQGVANGTITKDMLCAVTDDYYYPVG